MNREHAKGASKSLNKTITEIMEFSGDRGERPTRDLREFMYEKIGDLAERWFRRGFSRGHKESHEAYLQDGAVPERLEFDCKRSLSPTQDRELKLKSTIRRESGKSKSPKKKSLKGAKSSQVPARARKNKRA